MDEFTRVLKRNNKNLEDKCKMIFTSIFVLQNRLQTAGEKIQKNMTMKQWLLLAITINTPEPRNLTNIGKIMGCSRQNVKKLALALERKSFVRLINSTNNSLCLELTDKVNDYTKAMASRLDETLRLLFSIFDDEEINILFELFSKIFLGLEKVEQYSEELN